jgi:S1-C subfamily serine protease
MTVGIISAIGRSMPVGSIAGGPSYSIPDVIQTDAPINPGNSGGVLVNDLGEVIGVTFAIESPVAANAGIGFVIPSAIVQRVVPSLISKGTYEHPYLGISALPLNPDLAKAMDLKSDQHGALVEEVVPGGPADKAGLKGSSNPITIDGQNINVGGDVIVAIDGQSIDGMDDLIAYLSNSTAVGQQIDLTILRDGKEEVVGVVLEARPNQPEMETAQSDQSPQENIQTGAWLGILGATVTPEIAAQMSLDENQQGVIIQQVVKDSPASKADLQNEDIITTVDGKSIATIEELKGYLSNFQPGQEVTLTLLREGNELSIVVTLESRQAEN